MTADQAAAERTLDENLPDPGDVEALTTLLDLMADFPSNEQRARYLLSCNWMRDRGAAAAERIAGTLEQIAGRKPKPAHIILEGGRVVEATDAEISAALDRLFRGHEREDDTGGNPDQAGAAAVSHLPFGQRAGGSIGAVSERDQLMHQFPSDLVVHQVWPTVDVDLDLHGSSPTSAGSGTGSVGEVGAAPPANRGGAR